MADKRDIVLRELLNIFDINESDDLYFENDFGGIDKFNHFLVLLRCESLGVEKIKRKLECVRYYFEFPNQPGFKESKTILVTLKKQNKPSFELFIEHLCNELDNIKHDVQVKHYILFYPISINEFQNEINEFCINGLVINLLNYSDAKSFIDKINFEEYHTDIRGFDKTKYQYAKVSVYSRNYEYAQQKATEYVELLLFFISYSKTFRIQKFWFWGFPEPLIKLKLNYAFVFEEDDFYTGYTFEDASEVNEFYNLHNNDINNLNIMITQFNEADHKVKEVIHDSMNQFHIGLKEKNTSKSFLSFWTSLEILTLKTINLSHLDVKNRLKSIIVMNDIHEYQIERLYNLRNKLVHTGNNADISPFDKNLMKRYVEELFQYFMFRLSKYRFSDINIIYDLLQRDVTYLENNKSLIDKVIELKSPKP
jgi:hypothetical protein